jgi:hypothetical protein
MGMRMNASLRPKSREMMVRAGLIRASHPHQHQDAWPDRFDWPSDHLTADGRVNRHLGIGWVAYQVRFAKSATLDGLTAIPDAGMGSSSRFTVNRDPACDGAIRSLGPYRVSTRQRLTLSRRADKADFINRPKAAAKQIVMTKRES